MPTVLPGFTDSRCVPRRLPRLHRLRLLPAARTWTLYETAPLIHGADERIDVRDLGFAAAFYHHLAAGAAGMSASTEEAAPRRHGAAQRPAGPWPDALGRGGARRRRRDPRRVRPKPRIAATERVPGVRGVVSSAEAIAVIPLVKRALPEAQLPFSRARARRDRRRRCRSALIRRRGRGGRRRRGRGGGLSMAARAGRAARRRPRRLPRRRAQGDRRLRAGRRRRRRRRRRSTTAAARTSWRRCSPPTSRARCCSSGWSSARRIAGAGVVALGVDRHRGGGVRLVGAPRGDAPARALRRPGYELQRAIGTREPTAEQLDVGRAALAEILRVEAQPAP